MFHFVIGDIHGCFKHLLLLEKKIQKIAAKHKEPYKIISTGDLIDRGPNSRDVVNHFVEGENNGTHIAIMGNHETEFLRYLNIAFPKWCKSHKLTLPCYLSPITHSYKVSRVAKIMQIDEYNAVTKYYWLIQGGLETLTSYTSKLNNFHPEKMPMSHLKYIRNLPLFFEHKNFIVTHALPVAKSFKIIKKYYIDKKIDLVSVRQASHSVLWNRSKEELRPIGNKILISGHTAKRNVRRISKANIIQIDTRCFKLGKLTAFCPELDCSFSVSC